MVKRATRAIPAPKAKKGEKGDKGAQGAAGKDGTDGVDGKDGQDGVGIANVTVSDQGALSVTLTNGTVVNLGNIQGTDGIGIAKAEINSDGRLVLTYSDGTVHDLGPVVGADGQDGTNGQDGLGIKSVTVSADGQLSITYSDNSVVDLGNIKGEKGEKGEKGDKGDTGEAGRGIAKTALVNGELIVTYTDGTQDNLGKPSSTDSDSEYSDGLEFVLNEDQQSYMLYSFGELAYAKKVVVPETYKGKPVTKIASKATYNEKLYTDGTETYCVLIEELVLPSTLQSIGENAFQYSNIRRVVFNGTVLQWLSISFNSAHSNPLFYSPDDNEKELYIDGKLVDHLIIPEGATRINRYAFANCGSLKTVVIPKSVTFVGWYSFNRCRSLTSVTFEDPTGWHNGNGSSTVSLSNPTAVASALAHPGNSNLITGDLKKS